MPPPAQTSATFDRAPLRVRRGTRRRVLATEPPPFRSLLGMLRGRRRRATPPGGALRGRTAVAIDLARELVDLARQLRDLAPAGDVERDQRAAHGLVHHVAEVLALALEPFLERRESRLDLARGLALLFLHAGPEGGQGGAQVRGLDPLAREELAQPPLRTRFRGGQDLDGRVPGLPDPLPGRPRAVGLHGGAPSRPGRGLLLGRHRSLLRHFFLRDPAGRRRAEARGGASRVSNADRRSFSARRAGVTPGPFSVSSIRRSRDCTPAWASATRRWAEAAMSWRRASASSRVRRPRATRPDTMRSAS